MTREDYAKERAGYAACDTPCEPRRSAYTDDTTGLGAFMLAQSKWDLYIVLVSS